MRLGRFSKICGHRGHGCLLVILLTVLALPLIVTRRLSWTRSEDVWPSKEPSTAFKSTQSTWRQSCTRERTNFVYIKNHKSASETLSAMFRRFGFKRQLSFVLPTHNRNNLGWPWPLDPGMYRPNKTPEYNILCEHSVYDEEFYQSLMPPDTIFTTSLREPFSRFKSAFSYFNVAEVLGIESKHPINTFLKRPDKFEDKFKSEKVEHTPCVPAGVSVLRNVQAFNLGFPVGFPGNSSRQRDQTNNATFVHSWLASVKTRFKFAIITEHLLESLILWRRLMCWTLEDIIYYSRNFGVFTSANLTQITNESKLRKVYRQWSSIDVQLYDHYNRSLWKYIAQEGPGFWQELDVFIEVMRDVTLFCGSVMPGRSLVIRQSRWNERFVIAKSDCNLLKGRLMSELKDQYDSIAVEVPERQRTGPPC